MRELVRYGRPKPNLLVSEFRITVIELERVMQDKHQWSSIMNGFYVTWPSFRSPDDGYECNISNA